MNYELKKQYYDVYKNIHQLQEKLERDVGDLTPKEKEEIRMMIIQNYLIVGEREPAITLLKEYIEQWVTPRDLFRSPAPIRAFVILLMLYINTGRLALAEEYLERFKTFIKYSDKDNTAYSAIIAYTDVLAMMIDRRSYDENDMLLKIQKMEDFYEKRKNTLPVDFAVTIYSFFSNYFSSVNDLDEAIGYWKKAFSMSESSGLKFRTCELYRKLSEMYEKAGLYKEALENYNLFCNGRKEIWTAKEYAYSDFLIAEYGIKSGAEIEKDLRERNNSLGEKAVRDSLTGLYNRRYLNKVLDEIFMKGDSVMVHAIMFDIDFFKRYNDNYGHMKGDRVLEKIGELLGTFASESILTIRYGGEEFLLLICEQSETETEIVAHTVLQEIQNRNYEHEYSDVAKCLTLSAGLASLECSSKDDIYTLCDMADKALYIAKNNGRNTCVRYEK
ncbi:MAG: GGDEF domain-containing protein [Treponemataceae bacterium]|nr:GGDEF domain-containing protein [Treponemataceae bacterium]